jgi:hypothetical protein
LAVVPFRVASPFHIAAGYLTYGSVPVGKKRAHLIGL